MIDRYDFQLTGHTRYRMLKRMFRKDLLVLQVQETYQGVDSNPHSIMPEQYKRWRDATVIDLQVLQKDEMK